MTPEQLKASIFQYALQGKLVEQRENEGDANELFKTIQNSTTNKKIKMTEIQDDEKEYDIPSSWKWVRLGSICNIINGFTPQKSNPEFWNNGTIPWFTIEDVRKQGRFIEKTGQFISEKALSKGTERIVPPETVLLCCTASVGEYAYTKIALTTNQQFNALVIRDEYKEFVLSMYIYQYVQTLKKRLLNSAGKTTFSFLSVGKLSEMVIPIPPLAEQHRIVAKIEELLPFVDRYAASYEKLEQFNAKFPEDMKKSILQYAIQGKLVEQRPEEGTAEELYKAIQEEKQKLIKEGKIKKEKPLAEITEDEIPFDIPDSWKWVRLGRCGCFERGSGIKKDEVIPEGKPCVRYGQLYTTYKTRFSEAVSFVPQELFDKCHIVKQGDVLMALTGENEYDIALAVTYEGEEDVAMGGDMTRFYNHCMNPLYLTYVINSRYGILCKSKMASGNIIVHISNDKLATIPIPLPPLKEQHRIVAKIEELLPYCDQLIK